MIRQGIIGFCIALCGAIIIVYFLTGCKAIKNATQDNVREYVLEDGTKCLIYHKGLRGGISCNWEKECAVSN